MSANGSGKYEGGNDLGRVVSVTLTAEQFEQLYLQPGPKSRQAAEMAKSFGNPTPIGVMSFVVTFTSVSACLMGWGGASANSLPVLSGVATLFGGLGLWVAAILEFIVGNSFPSLVFASFGSFWLVLGYNQQPLQAITASQGGLTTSYTQAFAAYLFIFAIYDLMLMVASLRTNFAFFIVFLTVFLSATILGVGYVKFVPDPVLAGKLFKAGGAIGFVCSATGFWIVTSLTLSIVGFPVTLPLGDFTRLMPGNSPA